MLKLKNNATALLGASLNTSATTMTLANNGALFPALAAGEWFPITVISASNPANFEIMRVTARSNNVMTVTRAQEGTSAKVFSAGDIVDLRLTSGALEEGFPKQVGTAGGKNVRFSVSAVANGATRTVNIPNKDVDLDLKDAAYRDVASSLLDADANKLMPIGYRGIGKNADLRGTIFETGSPEDVFGTGVTSGLAQRSALGVPAGYLYGTLTVYASYQDYTAPGAYTREYRTGNRLFVQRDASSTTWGPWTEVTTNFSLSGTTLTITRA